MGNERLNVCDLIKPDSRQLKDGENIKLDDYTGLSVYVERDGLLLRVVSCYIVIRTGDTVVVITQRLNEDGTEGSDPQGRARVYDKHTYRVEDVLLEYENKVRTSGAEVMEQVTDAQV